MIDRIIEIEKDVKAVAIKNISINENYFQGHFPGLPIMPGALILEAVAQTGIVLYCYSRRGASDMNFLFGGVKARFLRSAVPGDRMVITVEPERFLSTGGVIAGTARVDDNVICTAHLSFSVRKKQPPHDSGDLPTASSCDH